MNSATIDTAHAAQTRPREGRAASRVSSFVWARIRTVAGREVECIVLDYSFTGVRLRLQSTQDLGDYIYLIGHSSGERTGRIMWRRGDQVGIRFQPLPQVEASPVLRAILRRLRQ